MASILKVDELQGITAANDITVTVGATATQFLRQGILKGYAYVSGNSTLGNNLNVASFTDNGSGQGFINLTNNLDTATEPFVGVAIGAPNPNVVTYEADTASTSASCRYGTTLSSNSDALTDSNIYTVVAGDLA